MRTSSGIEIRTLPGKILDIENWLVLGFPPARTVTWQPITSPTLEPAYQRTQPDDLLPLVSGDAGSQAGFGQTVVRQDRTTSASPSRMATTSSSSMRWRV